MVRLKKILRIAWESVAKSQKIEAGLKSVIWGIYSLFERLRQNSYTLNEVRQAKKLVVFLLPERPVHSGGILSIVHLCITTRKLLPDAIVVLATFPSFETYSRLLWFENSENIYRFSQIINEELSAEEVWIHIPEYLSASFVNSLTKKQKKLLKAVAYLHINILNQNILLMPERSQLEDIFCLAARMTQTTAHDSYTRQDICDRWRMPLHYFSAILPNPLEGHILPCFEAKKAHPLIVFSPDEHPARQIFHERIQKGISSSTITIVRHLSYTEYFSLISRAMFVVTFGEGFDAYFTQPFLVNTISFSVFQPDFFPSPEWKELENVFDSYEDAAARIVQKMNELLDNKTKYFDIIQKNKTMIYGLYSQSKVDASIQRFYQHDYDFMPTKTR